jgi:hypothetical protein
MKAAASGLHDRQSGLNRLTQKEANVGEFRLCRGVSCTLRTGLVGAAASEEERYEKQERRGETGSHRSL